MKITKIGNSGTGGNSNKSIVTNFNDRTNLIAKQICFGEIVKGDDISEDNPVDFVITWEYSIWEGNGRHYSFDRIQHYRLYEQALLVEDKDLEDVIIETYTLFIDEFNNRNKKGYLIPITTLTHAKIQEIVQDLKQLSPY